MIAPGSTWRTLSWIRDASEDVEAIEHSSDDDHSIFDELVIDEWFHLEQMDDDLWWMRVGDHVLHVRVGRDGRARTVSHEMDP